MAEIIVDEEGGNCCSWYPFWLDNPGEWQIRRTIETSIRFKVPERKQFVWLANSQNLARKFLHEEWECPCGKKVAPVWESKPLSPETKAMLFVANPLPGKRDDKTLEKMLFEISLSNPSAADRLERLSYFFEGPRKDEALKATKAVYSFRNNPTHCERLRAFRELTQMPWMDRLRAMSEVTDLVPLSKDAKYVELQGLEESGALHRFFPHLHDINESQEENFAALMALANNDAKIFNQRNSLPRLSYQSVAVKMTWKFPQQIWDTLKHVNPSVAPDGINSTCYVVFPRHYLETIVENSYW